MKNLDEQLSSKLLLYNKHSARLQTLENMLSENISEVVAVSDRNRFLEEMNNSPDMIIMHLYEDVRFVLSEIRKISEFIPIVILTDNSNINDVYPLILEFDVNRIMIEPIDKNTLLTCISKSIYRFSKQERSLYTQRKFIGELLDMSRDLLIITDGKKIIHVNNAFLEYSKTASVAEFLGKYPDLNGLLINYDNAFYKDKLFDEWVNKLLSETLVQDYERSRDIIRLKNLSIPDEPSTFLLNINKFKSSDLILITLNDITDFENEKQYYKEIAQYDTLTSIYNRKKFNEELVRNMGSMVKLGVKVSLIIFDIDHFKMINDRYGHSRGDDILKEIVSIVKNSIRRADIFSRYGGEEFTIIMPDTNIYEATDTAERIRRSLETYKFTEVEKVTCSFGVTCMQPNDTPETFLKRADKSLYNAKNSGRNKVVAMS